MSEIYSKSVTDGRKSNVATYWGIFPSMLKNHLYARDGLQAMQSYRLSMTGGF